MEEKREEKRPFTKKQRGKRRGHLIVEATEILISLSGVAFQLRLLCLLWHRLFPVKWHLLFSKYVY